MPKSRKVSKVAPYVYQLRDGSPVLYAVLELSQKLRVQLGKSRFVKSLQTTDIKKATKAAQSLIDEWKRQIEQAKKEPDSAAKYRIQLMMAKANGDVDRINKALDAIELEASNIGSTTYPFGPSDNPSPAEVREYERAAHDRGQDFYDRATGKYLPLGDHIKDWIEQSSYSVRVGDEATKMVSGFIATHKDLSLFNRQKIQAYINRMHKDGSASDTINKHLSYLRNFWRYVQRTINDEKVYQFDPFNGLHRPESKQTRAKQDNLPYTKQQVNELIDKSTGTLRQIITLGAYTGCRIEELSALKIDDVHDREDIPFFRIRDGKTQAAMRDVPIHKGILSLVRMLKRSSVDSYLITGLTVSSKTGERGATIRRDFSKYKTSIGYEKNKYTFHSFRSTVITQLKAAGVLEYIAAETVGHKIKTMSYGLYGDVVPLAVKAEALSKLSYKKG